MEDRDVVIVGAGITGSISARELAPDHDVLVLEKGEVAGEASGFAGGMISTSMFYHDLPVIAEHAHGYFRHFDGTEGFDLSPRPRVGLVEPELADEFRERGERLESLGAAVSWLNVDAVNERYPAFDTECYAGAVEYRNNAFVEPDELTRALARDAKNQGAEIRTETAVTDLLVEDGTVIGVETADGKVGAQTVVSAVGWRIRPFLSDYVDLPIRPIRFQVAILDPGIGLGDSFPMGHTEAEGLYFRPRYDGTFLVGNGFSEEDPEGKVGRLDASDEFMEKALRRAKELIPKFEDAELINAWGAVTGMLPDVRPIVDESAELDGLIVAQASAVGIQSSPILGTGVRSLVADEECPFSLAPFNIDRFTSGDVDWEAEGLPEYFQVNY